jgi:glycine cleavage system transcriptional repressor
MKLAVSFLAQQQPELLGRLLHTIADAGCRIQECHSSLMGNRLGGHLLATGDWHQIARLENALKTLAPEPELLIQLSRTESWEPEQTHLPYTIEVYAYEHDTILQELSTFLSTRNILLTQINTNRNRAAKITTELFCINLKIGIPAATRIINLREEFLDFCDDINIDAILEPIK